MSYIVQFMAAKLPVLAGAGILGVSVVGIAAGIVGVSFTLEAELLSAVLSMAGAALVVTKRPDR